MSMRRSNKPEWMLEGEVLVGVGLGSDCCSEHEWGTKELQDHFGLDAALDGLPRRTVTVTPSGLELLEFKTRANSARNQKASQALAIFYRYPSSYGQTPLETLQKGELQRHGEEGLSAAWDEKSFALVAYAEEDRKKLKQLWEAFQRKDIAFWPNVGVFHTGTGLTFAIPSLVSQANKELMLEGDLDYKLLLKKSEAIGIETLLKEAGKRWYALSPKWSKELKSTKDGEVKTTHEVLYWLNPMEQSQYNSGWYTVEDLKLWAKNEGPVVKRPD
jgi:hypothetical protein